MVGDLFNKVTTNGGGGGDSIAKILSIRVGYYSCGFRNAGSA